MHVLGHSFSQKRKCSKRPRDLHIRKISFSGSSLSDGSLSSDCSTASARTAIPPLPYGTSTIASPTQAPLRLHERPFKSAKVQGTTFYDSALSDDEDYEEGGDVNEIVEVEGTQFHMEMPPHTTHIQEDTTQERHESSDYFFFQHVTKRPPIPRSRWSESTIQTLDQHEISSPTPGTMTPRGDEGTGYYSSEDEVDMEGPPVQVELPPNFSHKYLRTVSAPEARRPPMRTMDSVEDFIKRGGWKRRGIVFDKREVGMRDSDCFTVI
jgi:hypothetical protein